MLYEEKYEEYLEAERELYLSKLKKKQAEEELEGKKREAQATQMVYEVFEKETELYQKRAETYENSVKTEQHRLSSLVPPKVKIKEEEFKIEKKEMIVEDLDAILNLHETDFATFLQQENLLKQALLSGGMIDSYDNYIKSIEELREEEKQQAIERLEYEFPSLEEIEKMPSDIKQHAQKQVENTVEKEIYETAFIEIPRIKESLSIAKEKKQELKSEIEMAKIEHYGKSLGNKKILNQEEFEAEQKRLDQVIEDYKKTKDSYLWNHETFVRSKTTYTKEFSFTKLAGLEEKKQNKIKEEIDHQIQQYQWSAQGEKPVHSIKEYQDFIETSNKKIEEWNIEKNSLQNTKNFFPENINDFYKTVNVSALDDTFRNIVLDLQNAREEEKSHQDNLKRIEYQGTPLPETFTELKNLKKNPVLYTLAVDDINKVIQAKRNTKDLNNLDEYWNLEREYETAKEQYNKEQKEFHDKRKTLGTVELKESESRLAEWNKKKIELQKQYYESKDQIKGWIKEENKLKNREKKIQQQQKNGLNLEKAALSSAKNKVKEAENTLIAKIQAYNQSQKENTTTRTAEIDKNINELRKKQEEKKRFLKDHVIQNAMNYITSTTEADIKQAETQKNELKTYWENVKKDPENISDRFKTNIEENEKEITNLENQYEEKKKITDLAFKNEADKRKSNRRNMQLYKDYQENAKQTIENKKVVISAQKKEIEKRIKTVNANNRDLNILIEEQSKQVSDAFGSRYDDHVNQIIQRDEENQFKQAKSNYRIAGVKMKVMGMAASLMGNVTQTYRDQLIKVTEGIIKGELVEKENQRNELIEKINRMSQGQSRLSEASVSNQGTTRQRITFDALETERLVQTGNSLQKSQNDLNKSLVQLNQEIEEMKQSQEQRIQENRERIDSIFHDPSRIDANLLKRRNEIMHQISQEVEQELPSAGDQKAQYQVREEELNQFISEDEMLHNELQKSIETIQQGSDSLKSLLTETNLSRMDLVANVIVKACNVAIGKINEANNNANPIAPINLEQSLDELENTLSSDEPKAEHLLTKVFKIGTLVYDKMTQVNQSVQEMNQEMVTDFLVSKQNYDGLIRQNEKLKQAQLAGNLLEQKQEFYNHEMEKVKEDLREREEFSRTAAEKTAEQQKKIQSDIQKKQEEIYGVESSEEIQNAVAENKSLNQIVQENQKNLEAKRDSMHLAFAQTVKEHENEPASLAELNVEDDILSNEFQQDNFEFLSKLTGVPMNKDMPLDMAMNAFGRIYINGLNAIDYFNLDERYKNARYSDPQQDMSSGITESQKLVQGLVYYGESIRQALEAQVNPERKEHLQGDAKCLFGQMLAVEDKNMKLSPVKLNSNDPEVSKKAETFNKHSDLIAKQWNEMRSMAAEFEIAKQAKGKDTEKVVKEEKREKINLLEEKKEQKTKSIRERLTEAIHRSRSLRR